ncbi:MAG: serine/threonine-protein kinase [Gemmataceae bacterium]
MDPFPETPSDPPDESVRTERAPTLVRAEPPRPAFSGGLGQRIGDFILLRELGRGGFARVYLAHQVSLERRVALKVSRIPSRGEGQTLGSLEHDHIVKVYAEFADAESGQHGLVLQYIPGASLAEVLGQLYKDGRRPTQGAEILQAIDMLARDEVEFDPIALRDRDILARSDYVAGVCRLGARLAEGLAFAHARGILHCDIKPGNILLNRYGRPLLVDFNVSVPIRDEKGEKPLGGTMLYMAPEQLAAFARLPGGDARKVDQRSDLYALGLVLLEMLLGRLPQRRSTTHVSHSADQVLTWKQKQPEEWLPEHLNIPIVIWRILRRCLDPDPDQRYASCADLAKTLHHAAIRADAVANLPPDSRLAAAARRRPIVTLLSLVLLPQIIGTIVNISYNESQLNLTPEQLAVFPNLVLGYNSIAYPICVLLGWFVLRPLVGNLNKPEVLAAMPIAELDRLRRHSLRLGSYAIGLAFLGWIPGGFIFPIVLHVLTGPPGWILYAHFLTSFTLSGFIAMIYSYFGAQYVVLRGIYLRLVHAEQQPHEVRRELDNLLGLVGLFQVLAALVPLTGAVLLLSLASGYLTIAFRVLVVALIIAGMIGLGIAVYVSHSLREIVAILKGPGAEPPKRGTETAYFG